MADQGYHGQPDLGNFLKALDRRLSALERTRTIPSGDGAPTSSPADGAQYMDTTNGDYYVRSAGAWVKVHLT